MAHRLPLSELPSTLKNAGHTPPRYRTCYTAATDARIPACKNDSGRWTFLLEDLPDIADAMCINSTHAA
jgi:hypothetical protein